MIIYKLYIEIYSFSILLIVFLYSHVEMNSEVKPQKFDYVRGRNDAPYLFGSTQIETARKMLRELTRSQHFNYWDESDTEMSNTHWLINENISSLENFSLHLSPLILEIIERWNQLEDPKRLTVCYYDRRGEELYVQFYYDGEKQIPDCDLTFPISEEETIQMLYVMIHHNVHNSNGWKLDGSHFYEPEKYPPTYPLPDYLSASRGEFPRKRRRDQNDDICMEF